MSSKCLEFECEYNKPVMQQKCVGVKRRSGKFFKRKSQQVSGRCMLGAFKRNQFCKVEEDE